MRGRGYGSGRSFYRGRSSNSSTGRGYQRGGRSGSRDRGRGPKTHFLNQGAERHGEGGRGRHQATHGGKYDRPEDINVSVEDRQANRKMKPNAVGHLVSETFRIETMQLLNSIRDEGIPEATFPPTLDNTQRRFIHMQCAALGLYSKSHGKGEHRQLKVFKSKISAKGVNHAQTYHGAPKLRLSEDILAVIENIFDQSPISSHDHLDGAPIVFKANQRVQDRDYLSRLSKEQRTALWSSNYAAWQNRIRNPTPGLLAIQQARKLLPIYTHRSEIISQLSRSQIFIVSGETGCGKSTQVPQYILEDPQMGPNCNIVCTQPRRISAISLAERVASERGESVGASVGYSIRLDRQTSPSSQLTFVTTGVLLRQMVNDPTLSQYTHVVLDEVHERDKLSDMLLILIRDVLPQRPDLRIVLMSATMQIHTFQSYFHQCPVIHVMGTLHPVTECYLEDILLLTSFIKLPDNGEKTVAKQPLIPLRPAIIESDLCCPSCRAEFQTPEAFGAHIVLCDGIEEPGFVLPPVGLSTKDLAEDRIYDEYDPDLSDSPAEKVSTSLAALRATPEKQSQLLNAYQASWDDAEVDILLIEALLNHIEDADYGEGAVLVFLPGWDDISRLAEDLESSRRFGDRSKYWILLLHSGVSPDAQRRVFHRPPEGCRKIILSTNIAETSVTIDDVVYVIDAGKMKVKSFDPHLQLCTFGSEWVSKANARQRKGRAGRTRPGVCFHLYSSLRHESLEEFPVPELLRTPLDELCLQVKLLIGTEGENSILSHLSKAPDPPSAVSISSAVKLLQDIGALTKEEDLTELGYQLASLPMEPKLGKMALLAYLFGCFDPVVTVGCMLSYRDPFVLPVSPDQRQHAAKLKLALAEDTQSDHYVLWRAFSEWKHRLSAEGIGAASRFCRDNCLSPVTMSMLDDMREQLKTELSKMGYRESSPEVNENAVKVGVLLPVIAAGLSPNLAMRRPGAKNWETKERLKAKPHTTSVNSQGASIPNKKKSKKETQWAAFNEIVQTKGVFYVHDSSWGKRHSFGRRRVWRTLGEAERDFITTKRDAKEMRTEMLLKRTRAHPLALLLLWGTSARIVVPEREDDGSDEEEDEIFDDSDIDEDELIAHIIGDIGGYSAKEPLVQVTVDDFLSYKMPQELAERILVLRQRVHRALIYLISHPGRKLPKNLRSSVDHVIELLVALSPGVVAAPQSQTFHVSRQPPRGRGRGQYNGYRRY